MKMFGGYVYIVTNKTNKVLYTGVSSNLLQRIYQHKHNLVPGFTAKYNIHKLVYYKHAERIEIAIEREKQIKAGSRKKKILLISSLNPKWEDLYDRLTK